MPFGARSAVCGSGVTYTNSPPVVSSVRSLTGGGTGSVSRVAKSIVIRGRFVGLSVDIADMGRTGGGWGSTRGGREPVLESLSVGDGGRGGSEVGKSRFDPRGRNGIIGWARLGP